MGLFTIVTANTWYYTLSTVGQTLAALTGLFSVFVIYKIQIIIPTIEDSRIAFIQLIERYSRVIKQYEKKDFSRLYFLNEYQILKEVEKINSIKKEVPSKLSALIPGINFKNFIYDISDSEIIYYKQLLAKKGFILKMFYLNFFYNLLMILISITLLAFSDFFSLGYSIIFHILSFILVGFVLLVLTTWQIIKA